MEEVEVEVLPPPLPSSPAAVAAPAAAAAPTQGNGGLVAQWLERQKLFRRRRAGMMEAVISWHQYRK